MELRIKSCINCGSFLFIKYCLCRFCYTAVVDKFGCNIKTENGYGLSVRTLLQWNPGESDGLSALMYILKKNQKNLWKDLAYEFIRKQKIKSNTKLILVSLQANHSTNTHAQDWGDSLADLLGCMHIVALKKSAVAVQKQKSKSERKQVELVPIVDISSLQHKKVIFVDDIITTGATLKAAYRALGSPPQFECWSMAMRTTGSIAQ